jgi:hypothetical protein
MVAETLGVGLSSAWRDSSKVDTLATNLLEGGTDISYVTLSYQLTCLFASPDSVILRLRSRIAGRIEPQDDHEAFVYDTSTSTGYPELVKRARQWRWKGPISAVAPSPAAALRRYGRALDANSRQVLARLAARRH